jgi:hypothetical protein
VPSFLLLLLLLASLTPSERKLRASIAGLTGWANTKDRKARAKHASNGLYEKFLRTVDPDNTLPENERAKLADSLYRAHFQRMSFNASKARRLRMEQQQRDAQAMRDARNAQSGGGVDGAA